MAQDDVAVGRGQRVADVVVVPDQAGVPVDANVLSSAGLLSLVLLLFSFKHNRL